MTTYNDLTARLYDISREDATLRPLFNAIAVAVNEFETATDSLKNSIGWLESRTRDLDRAVNDPTRRVNQLGEMQSLGSTIDSACGRREAARHIISSMIPMITDESLRSDFAAVFTA